MRTLLLLLLCAPLAAAPPAFDPPAELRPTGGYAVFVPKADCVAVEYIALDGEEPFPLSVVGGSKTAFFFPTRGLPAGKRFRFVGVASSATGELVRKDFAVLVAGAPDKPIDPPIDPPPPPSGALYFALVRQDGPAANDFTRFMESTKPQWDVLRNAGHSVRDVTLAESKALNFHNVTQVPCVVILRVHASGKSADQLGLPVAFPRNAAEVLALPKAAP